MTAPPDEKGSPTCILCGSTANRRVLTAANPRFGNTNEYHVAECADCALRFLDLEPGQTVKEAAYHEGYEEGWGVLTALKHKVEHATAKTFPGKPPGKLLDVGAGTGDFVRAMEKKGWDVTGVEPFADHYSEASRHPAVIPARLEDAGLAPESFDVATMWMVIEHCLDPVAELKSVRKLLKPDGVFTVSTVNYDSWEAQLWGRYWHHLVLPDHCCLFKPDVLVRALRMAGFEPVRVRHLPMTAALLGSFEGYVRERGGDLGPLHAAIAAMGAPLELLAALVKKSGWFAIDAKPGPVTST